MMGENPIETGLHRAATLLRCRRILLHTGTLGCVCCLVATLLAAAMIREWLDNTATAMTIIALLGIAALFTWLILFGKIFTTPINRKSLAASVEGADPRLLDRLNTLVFLEKNRRGDAARWFFSRIARQTLGVLKEKSPPVPVSFTRPLIHLGAFAILLLLTTFFCEKFHPWQHLVAADAERRAHLAAMAKAPPNLALPTNSVTEENKVWGEVRITDPARDLKVTKVDVVPLQIEAAASQSLKQVSWFSTINGNVEQTHILPAPPEPRYAVYQPVVYLDEFHLADWDVLTYYANAGTDHGDRYASDIYFLEVRPFREDILKLPGGEGGKAYQFLSEMTSLIERQQHVIRQTHQYEQTPNDPADLREQDRQKLAGGEDDLGDSVRHLYAEMTTEMENQPIGEALDNLAKSERSLDDASESLTKDAVKEGEGHERTALADLVAARKMFQKAISDHPNDFKDKPDNDENTPGDTSKTLNDIAEFRNETKAAQDFVKKLAAQQHKLATKAEDTPRLEHPNLVPEETKLQKSLADFEQQHPKVFRPLTNETAAASKSLEHAANSLNKHAADARDSVDAAANDLDDLASAVQQNADDRQLGDAYKLKQVLEHQIDQLKKMEQATNNLSPTNRQQTAADSRETLRQLRQITESKSGTNDFGPDLHESLTGTNRSSLDSQLSKLTSAQNPQQQKDAAGAARHGLENVNEAFARSQPSALQAAKKSDSLKPGQQEAFERGMAQLESLKQQLESGHPLSAEQESKEMKEAAAMLDGALIDQYGHDDHAQKLVLLVDSLLKEKGKAPDLVTLKKLMDQLRNFSVEVADKPNKNEKPELTNIDPSRLPPAYRTRIERYYQKLSDQKP